MSEADKNTSNGGSSIILNPKPKLGAMLESYTRQLAGDEMAQKFVAQLSILLSRDNKLLQCTPDSMLAAMLACVHLRLMPNTPEQHAFIIPYMNKKIGRYEAQFQVGYKGLVQLSWRSQLIEGINAELVFPEDEFKTDFGKRELSHVPNLTIDRTDYSRALAVYAVASLPRGGKVFDVMSRSEIEKVRRTVKFLTSDSPWKSWEEAMVKKTPIKRLAKMLPQSPQDKLQYAATIDSWAEAGKLKATPEGELIEDKVETPERSPEEEAKIKAEAAEVAEQLLRQEEAGADNQEVEDGK